MANTKLIPGTKAPDFKLPDESGKEWSLKDLQGKKAVLFFYPKDNTPGCTQEACDFRDHYATLQQAGALLLGISKDSAKSHQNFKTKHGLPFPLLIDATGEMCETYGVWVEKSLYGKKYMGIERATFVLNEEGVLTHLFQPVKVPGHVLEVLKAISS